MSKASFEAVLEEYGLTAKWEAKGREEGRKEAVKSLQKYGMEPRQIAEALELPPLTVSRYLKAEDHRVKAAASLLAGKKRHGPSRSR